MRKLFLFILCLFSASVLSDPSVTDDAIKGKWLIVQVGDISPQQEGLGNDYWTFNGSQFTVETSGRSLRPDAYKIVGSSIVYGQEPYAVSIDVLSISEKRMTVRTSGITQVLEKIQ